jgi:hypothetical protein
MCLVDPHLYMKALQISRHVNHKDTFVQVKALHFDFCRFRTFNSGRENPNRRHCWNAVNKPTL